MNLEALWSQPLPIPYHAYAAFIAIAVGAWQLFAEKGSTVHKYTGYTWVTLLALVSVSSFWIHSIQLIGVFSPIHLISLFTLWTLYRSIRAAQTGDIARHQRTMKLLYFLALIVTGLLTLLPGRVMHDVLFS